MARSGTVGVSGVAVSIAAAGGLLLWTGITNRPVREALQDLLRGRPPGTTGNPTGPSLADITGGFHDALGGLRAGRFATGDRSPAADGAIRTFVETARAQLGKPYRWATAGPDTFDCSGLVSYCLKRAGLDVRRRVTAEYLVWDGAFTIPRDQCRYGDLVCWPGHIGIAISNTHMIHAPSVGRPVQEGQIWKAPAPVIRRIRGTGDSGSGGGGRSEVT